MKYVISLLIIGFNLSAYAENVDLGRQLMCLNGTKILQGVHKYVCEEKLAEKQILSLLEEKLEVKFRLNGLKNFISCRELLK